MLLELFGADCFILLKKLFTTKEKNLMAKANIPSVIEINSELKKKIIKPIYFLFGEDSFRINSTLSEIKKAVEQIIASDFDKETYSASNCNLADVISAAKTFPFGNGKKLIVVKNADEFKYSASDENFINYILSPAEFTVLVFLYEGKIGRSDVQPFKSLLQKNFLFHSAEIRGDLLIKWLIQIVEENNKHISRENATLLVDLVGENRNLLESQLEKIFEYLGDSKEITFHSIDALATKLKVYTIFNLFDAIDKKDNAAALKIAYNLLDSSDLGLIGIVAMLNKHFSALLRIDELQKSNLTDAEKAKATGTHPIFYKYLVNAARLYGHKNIFKALKAIFNADVQIKSSSLDEKTILTILIAEILS